MNNITRWKMIEYNGNPTNFYISENGSIRNMDTGKLLNTTTDKNGYKKYTLTIIPTKTYKAFAHRLVALAFIPNPENKPRVIHKDGNKDNNHMSNLEWTSSKEKTQHEYDIGLKQAVLGEDNPAAKYTEDNIRNACRYLELGIPIGLISERLNINRSYLSDIKSGRRWNHIWKEFKIQPYMKSSDVFKRYVELMYDQGYNTSLNVLDKCWGIYNKILDDLIKDIINEYVRASETIEQNITFSVDKT